MFVEILERKVSHGAVAGELAKFHGEKAARSSRPAPPALASSNRIDTGRSVGIFESIGQFPNESRYLAVLGLNVSYLIAVYAHAASLGAALFPLVFRSRSPSLRGAFDFTR